MNDCCKVERTVTICETVKNNVAMAADISAGMDTLLELLSGTEKENCDVGKPPKCLLDDVIVQASILSEIYEKLRRAIEILNG